MKTKNEFIRALNYELRLLNQNERDELISFYEDRFTNAHYEGKSEADVIQELESPVQIAKNIYDEYGIDPSNIKNPKPNQSKAGLIFGVICLDLFIVSWALPALYSLVFGLASSIFTFPLVFTQFNNYGILANALNVVFAFAAYFLIFVSTVALADLAVGFTSWVVSLHVKLFNYELSEEIRRFPHNFKIKKYFRMDRWNLKYLVPIALVALISSPIMYYVNYFGEDATYKVNNHLLDEPVVETYNLDYSSSTDFDFDVISEDVTVVVGNVDKIKIVLTSHKEDYLLLKEEGDKIKVYVKGTNKVTFNPLSLFSFNQLSKVSGSVTVTIPNDIKLDDIKINTVSGRINVTNLEASQFDFGTVSGNVMIDDSTSKETKVNTTSGDVDLVDSQVMELEVDTVSGDVDLKELGEVVNGIDIETVSGDTLIKGVYETEISIDSVSGDAMYYMEQEKENSIIEFDSVSGKYKTTN